MLDIGQERSWQSEHTAAVPLTVAPAAKTAAAQAVAAAHAAAVSQDRLRALSSVAADEMGGPPKPPGIPQGLPPAASTGGSAAMAVAPIGGSWPMPQHVPSVVSAAQAADAAAQHTGLLMSGQWLH